MKEETKFKFQTDSRPVIQGTEVVVEEVPWSKKRVRLLQISSVLNLAALFAGIIYAYLTNGGADWKLGLVWILLLSGSFTACVFGLYDRKIFEKEKTRFAMAAVRLHMVDFMLYLLLWLLGIFA